MLDHTLRILNFDESILQQKSLLSRYDHTIIEFKGLAPRARYWINKKARERIALEIRNSPKNAVTFLGSGDFHHISEVLISQFREPVNLIVFDFHPDWDTWPPRYGCGSWLSEVLRKKNIVKVLLLGVSSNDLDSCAIHSGNTASLKNNRVEIYPYAHPSSKAFLKQIPDNRSIRVERKNLFSTIHWQELKDVNLAHFFSSLLSRLEAKQAYVSIDKDCLQNEYALTNWEEGKFSLEELLLMLKLIKENLDIVGMDILGDYSRPKEAGLVKKIASYFDHPKEVKAARLPREVINSVNEETNLKILKLICS